jgi:hypothetical protein
MSVEIEGRPLPAKPNIDDVLESFLEQQRKRLAARTFSKYESVVELLRNHLNSYAYQGLSKSEADLFRERYDAKGKEHRDFCQLFGPEKIVENMDGFLGYFMIRKVMAGEELKRASGTVCKKLSKWLAHNNYISAEIGEASASSSDDAARELVQAERAARLLQEAADQLRIDVLALSDENYVDFDHFTVARVEPGRLWLDVWEEGKARPRGPIPAPKAATKLLQKGWDVSCALARVRDTWHIIEVANVYPL